MFSFIGLLELTNDNLTESKRTINLLQRMNIYQEVFLSVLYRFLPIQVTHHSHHLFTTDLKQTSINHKLTSTLAPVFVPVIPGAGVFLHLHRVLAPSGVCDCPVPHGVASLWLLAGWSTRWSVVHSQQVSNLPLQIDVFSK